MQLAAKISQLAVQKAVCRAGFYGFFKSNTGCLHIACGNQGKASALNVCVSGCNA